MLMQTWTVIHVVATVALLFIYETMKKARLARKSISAKCLGTFMAVSCAALAVTSRGGNPFIHPVFWFAVLCMVSDGLLEIHFIAGMMLFAASHIILLIWLITTEGFYLPCLAVWIILLVAAIVLFRRRLFPLAVRSLPYIFYAALLTFMCSVSITLPIHGGMKYFMVAFGALIFVVSDSLVAKEHFAGEQLRSQYLIMPLYWGALFFITLSLWML